MKSGFFQSSVISSVVSSVVLSLLAVVSVSATAFAGSKATTIYHDYDGALRGISISNACVTDTEVRTIAPTRNCEKLEPIEVVQDFGTVTEWVCKTWSVSSVAHTR